MLFSSIYVLSIHNLCFPPTQYCYCSEIGKIMSFYAVQAGRSPGVYRSWEDCSKQVHKYPKAIYKKFSTMSEATRFLQHPTYSYKPTEKVPASLVHTGSAEYLFRTIFPASIHARRPPGLNCVEWHNFTYLTTITVLCGWKT